MASIWQTDAWVRRAQQMLDSYEHWLGQPLLKREGTIHDQADALYFAPFVVVSHGTQNDPILCYGNQAALRLWELDAVTFCRTPSRETAEPVHRAEREALLRRTTRDGFVNDYRGIRISGSGRRFLVEQAIVWNVLDAVQTYQGQAATFSRYRFLTSNPE